MIRCGLVLFLLAAAAGAETPAERLAKVRAELAEQRAALAQWAFDEHLYREASYLVREVLREKPGHAIGALQGRLQQMSGADFAYEYKQAIRKRSRAFRKRQGEIAEPAAAELVRIAAEAAREGQAELAEEIYVYAFRVDGENRDAAKALKALDYDAIYNYGVLPKGEKDAARSILRGLHGSFLGRGDLKDELEFWTDAWGLKTRHYRFVTNAPHATVFAFATACEDLHDAWEGLMRGARVKVRSLRKPATIYFFDSPLTYQTILLTLGTDPLQGVLGFYDLETKIGYFFDDPEFYEGDLSLLFETFFHEGTHQLLDLRVKAAWKGGIDQNPLNWVEEGFCVYMESLKIEVASRRSYAFGEVIDDDLAMGLEGLRKGELMPLARFAHCDAPTWDAYDLGYPHAALLMHFLLDSGDPKLRKVAFELLLAEMTQRGLRKKSLFEMLRTTPEELETALRAHAADIEKRLPVREYGTKKR